MSSRRCKWYLIEFDTSASEGRDRVDRFAVWPAKDQKWVRRRLGSVIGKDARITRIDRQCQCLLKVLRALVEDRHRAGEHIAQILGKDKGVRKLASPQTGGA